MKNYRLLRRARQKGMTLIIGLIMLAVITVISITVANMVTVDLRIAGNQQAAQSAKMAAESGIDSLINDPAQLDLMAPFSPVSGDPIKEQAMPAIVVTGPTGSGWSATVIVERMGDPLPCPKALLPVNVSSIDSTTITKCVYFEMTSTGTSTRNSSKVLKRGFYRKVGGFVAG